MDIISLQCVPYIEDMSDVEVLAPGSQCEVAAPGEGLPEHPQQPGGLQPRHCSTGGQRARAGTQAAGHTGSGLSGAGLND